MITNLVVAVAVVLGRWGDGESDVVSVRTFAVPTVDRIDSFCLETTDLPIESIAAHCGFGTAISMRQHFARQTGTSPMAYRRTFRADDSVS
ncbi:MAG TPA: helix-turn-helix domain-containing protein [Microlunatus sp.]